MTRIWSQDANDNGHSHVALQRSASASRRGEPSPAFEPRRVEITREIELRREAVARWRGIDVVSCERRLEEKH